MGTQTLKLAYLPRRTTSLVTIGRIGEPAKRLLGGCACRRIPECSPRPRQKLVIKFNGYSPLHLYILPRLVYTS